MLFHFINGYILTRKTEKPSSVHSTHQTMLNMTANMIF